MAIKITSNFIPSGDTPNPNIWTHEDIYGKGGFVAILTTTDLPLINDHILQARRKEGMLVYDATLGKYWRCLSETAGSGDDNWTEETFGQSITIDSGLGINVTENNGTYTIALNASLNDLSDVDITGTPSDDQVLTWDGTKWIAKSIKIEVDGTDNVVANATSPFILWTPDAALPESKTLVGDGIIDVDVYNTDAVVRLFINDGSIGVDKLQQKTISGVELGNNLYALTFGVGLESTDFDNYDGSSAITLSIDFGTGPNQVAEGDHTHTLDQLSDVAITNSVEGDVVVYSGTNGWVNKNFIYGGSATSFA